MNFSYFTKNDIIAHIPHNMLSEALSDKNGTLSENEILREIHSAVADDIHMRISPKVKVPFLTNIPPIVKRAAVIFACEAVFERRKVAPKDNPFCEKAEQLREKLDKIGEGKAPISAGLSKNAPSAVIISTPAKTVSSAGRLSL